MNPTNSIPPITKEEALKYDKTALQTDIERRKKNIELFKGEINKEEAEIQRLFQIIAIIDANK
ncbi:hypothetical protein HZA76_00280 [Candidatus Roizmanbacteria bacterium]|nr:hypothetical protein [Candidatus Roizmanbacteria bacterium]